MTESPDTRYGRVIEGAHLAGYTLARMQDELLWLLEGERWKEVDGGHETVNDFLRSIDLSTWKLDERPKLARAIKAAQPKASNRAIAKALGVDEKTVRNDSAPDDAAMRDSGSSAADNSAPATKSGEDAHTAAAKAGKKATKKAERKTEDPVAIGETTARVECGEFWEVLADLRDVNVIFTDPPYAVEHMHLYGRLAEWAPQVLAADGVLAVMTGQTYLPGVFAELDGYLPYRWTMAYLTPGGQAVQIFPRQVNAFWKPVLLYGAARDWIGDVARSNVNDNDKADHEWGQSVSGVLDALGRLVRPGDVVVDPMCGAGTTGVAARALRCSFVGADIDEGHASTARERLGV